MTSEPYFYLLQYQDGPGTEQELDTGTFGTVFQKAEPEPPLSVKTVLKQKKTFPERNRRN